MDLREQSIVGGFPEFVFSFSVTQVLTELRKQFLNNFIFPTWASAAGFNNNNNNNNYYYYIIEQIIIWIHKHKFYDLMWFFKWISELLWLYIFSIGYWSNYWTRGICHCMLLEHCLAYLKCAIGHACDSLWCYIPGECCRACLWCLWCYIPRKCCRACLGWPPVLHTWKVLSGMFAMASGATPAKANGGMDDMSSGGMAEKRIPHSRTWPYACDTLYTKNVMRWQQERFLKNIIVNKINIILQYTYKKILVKG